jgi:hypothetical protein
MYACLIKIYTVFLDSLCYLWPKMQPVKIKIWMRDLDLQWSTPVKIYIQGLTCYSIRYAFLRMYDQCRSDQLAHPCCLIRICTVRLLVRNNLIDQKSEQCRSCSDCTNETAVWIYTVHPCHKSMFMVERVKHIYMDKWSSSLLKIINYCNVYGPVEMYQHNILTSALGWTTTKY